MPPAPSLDTLWYPRCYRFATMLPALGPLVEPIDRAVIRGRQPLAVEIDRHADGRVPELLLHVGGRGPVGEEERRIGVPG